MVDLDCLAFGAHPDDVELSCAGTLINYIRKGKKVGLIDLTRGELGSRGSAELRTKEAEASRSVMDAEIRRNLDLADGFFEETEESLLSIIRVIREFRPKIILANALEDRHPDHGRGARLVSRAAFLSGLVKITTELDGKPQEKWRPETVLHYIQDRHLKPQVVCDISDSFSRKLECIACFASQFYDPQSEEVNTPISGKDFQHFIEAKARLFGREIGVEFGEGFSCEKAIGFKDLENIF